MPPILEDEARAVAPAYPDLTAARFAQVILVSIALFTAMDLAVVSLLIEPIKQELHLTDFEAGLVSTTVSYGFYGLLCIPMGMLADRVNRARTLLVSVILWCGGLAVTGLSSSLPLLILGKIILGAANAITLPTAISLLSDYFAPERRSMAISSFGIGQVLGQAGAILIGGLGYGALTRLAASDPSALFGLTPWRVVSLVSILGGLVILPFLAAMREPVRQEVRQTKGGGVRELWAFRGFLLSLIGGIVFLNVAATALWSWIPPALTRLYDQQPDDFAGWYSTVTIISGVAGLFGAGKLATFINRRAGRGRLMLPAAFAAACCAPSALMAMMPTLQLFIVCVLIFSLAYPVASAISTIALGFAVPNELRGTTAGIVALATAGASALSAPLVALAGSMVGGEAGLGRGMALIGIPFALLSALCFLSATNRHDASSASASDR